MSTIWDAEMNISVLAAWGTVRSAQGVLHFDRFVWLLSAGVVKGFVAAKLGHHSVIPTQTQRLSSLPSALQIPWFAFVWLSVSMKARDENILQALLARARRK